MSTKIQTTIAPHSQKPVVTRTYPTEAEFDAIIQSAADAQRTWAKVPIGERIAIGYKFIEVFKKMEAEFSLELTQQMGRPISQTPGELRGMIGRAEYMLSIAEASLTPVLLTETDAPGFKRYINRVPLGVVLVLAPWNFPYLVAINSVLPAIVAGNAVLLKPSPQTPLVAERFQRVFEAAGLPKSVVQAVHLGPDGVYHAIKHRLVDFVSFTGSVTGGRMVEKAAADAEGFKGVALELGGKDPAYVRPDADLDYTVAELVDGAFFNSGQSCCAIERIYVHKSIFDKFISAFVETVKKYKLGDPTDSSTTLGPVVSIASADRIRKQIADAVAAGAKPLIPETLFPAAVLGSAFVAPQVLVNVNHSMDVMMEETFGPVGGIQSIASDEEALALMNDSPYGLTASVWTDAEHNEESHAAFMKFVDGLETGTVFLNRCDYLDPALAWTGVKNSGRGISLSKFGYDQLTRAKSVHMKIKTS
ncbi:succinate semialdehyde dehydrogenase [Fomitiporia mediterranea MF3/22]|uniref:succinate semialdehyde dehydrogenase n=1 Tax=Fomitiporia mediterranea (strain MF3/22) TaxID=694068 RepID=UPI00044082C7|nr:succinate semialdehyde dehydrogenase [Fomitiporia mediterranea MF3/22]EJD00314.1 succinate semialdehyde dehydrogenase [Fomitiporia mediterranea MF3/22]